jgi:hypothetical protein
MKPRLLVIGAGPMGLEAALRGKGRGWEVTVLEKGVVGENMRRWGHIQLFTPVSMNVSAFARSFLPPLEEGAFLTGTQHREQVLLPLARQLNILEQTRVIGVCRRKMLKTELVAHPLRAKRPFELLVEQGGKEVMLVADGIVDASGVFDNPRALGRGGLPVPGERKSTLDIFRHPPDFTASDWQSRLKDGVALIGNGHSAATAIVALSKLAKEDSRISWLVPDDRARPVDEVPEDPLPYRESLVKEANNLASKPPPWLKVIRRAAIFSLEHGLAVQSRAGIEGIDCKSIISLVGYQPDNSILNETAVDLDPAFSGGLGLGVALASVKSCLDKVVVTRDDLSTVEPDLYLAGHRAYGRRNTFLMQTGAELIETIFSGWELKRKD